MRPLWPPSDLAILIIALLPADLKGHCPLVSMYRFTFEYFSSMFLQYLAIVNVTSGIGHLHNKFGPASHSLFVKAKSSN